MQVVLFIKKFINLVRPNEYMAILRSYNLFLISLDLD